MPDHAPNPAPPPPPGMALPAHRPLALRDPGARWLVEAGEVTLFVAAPPVAPATEGARRHLGTLPPGAMLCGLGEGDAGEVVIAVGGAETRLVPLEPAALPAGEDGAARLGRAIGAWTSALAAGLAHAFAPAPRADRVLPPGGSIASRAREVVVNRNPGGWVRLGDEQGLLFGLEPVSGLTPLPPEAWLTLPAGRITALTAAEALADPGWEAGLARFNAACLAALTSATVLESAEEVNRLRLRAARDAEAGQEEQERFGAILGNALPPPAADDSDPLTPVLRLVAAHLGARVRRPVRVRRLDVDSPPTLDELARASDLRLRPVLLPDGWWRADHGALIGRRLDGTPVALLPEPGGYRLGDPAGGPPRRVDAALAAAIAREAQAVFLPLPRKALKLPDLLTFGMGGSGGDISVLALSMLAGAALGQAVPVATGLAFSLLIPGGHLPELAQLGLAVGLIALVAWVVRIGGEIARQRVEAKAGTAAHAALWDRVLRLPLSTFAKQTVGETTARAAAAVNLAAQLRGFAVVLGTSTAMILSSLVTMLVAEPSTAWVAVGLLAVQLLAANLAGWLQARAFGTGEALTGLADAMVFQIVGGLVKLRLAGAEARAQRVWALRFAEMRRRMGAARRIGNAYDAASAAIGVLSLAAAFIVLAMLQRVAPGQQPPSLSQVMTFVAAFGVMTAATAQLARTIFGLWFLLPSAKFARPLLEALPEETAGRVDPGQLLGQVEIANLTFRYGPADAWIFQGLSLRVEPGEFVAIVGRSGAGKSTLVRLLLGLEEPVSGAIYLDGHDLRGLDPGAVRRQVATVLQSGRLPPGSLLDAVRGLTGADEAQVWDALRRAALADDVRALPMGLQTVLTDANRVLSGGQVQRLLLARALLQKPGLLILDEATSALDNTTQAAVMRAVRSLPATRIVIAHRLSTIRHADRIIVLDGGRVVEQGRFADLIARRGGFFARQYAAEASWQAGAKEGA